MVKALIEAGADVNKANDRPIWLEGHEGTVKALIEAGADVNMARDNGRRRCHGRSGGPRGGGQGLIEAGADVNKATMTAQTPLYRAAHKATRRWSRL